MAKNLSQHAWLRLGKKWCHSLTSPPYGETKHRPIGVLVFFLIMLFTGAKVHLPFSTRTAQQKRTIKVRCTVTGEDFVAWETPSRAQWLNLTSQNATGRVRLQIKDNVNEYILVIEDVSVGDGGVYTCKGFNQSKNFTLEVDCKYLST